MNKKSMQTWDRSAINWQLIHLSVRIIFLLFNRAEAHILLVALRIAHVIRRDEHQLRYEYIVE